MPHLMTTLGPLPKDRLGLVLPHEHVFVDLRTPNAPGHAQAETGDVLSLMVPELERAGSAGISVLVECTPVGPGRRVDILKAVSEAANFPLVVPTGIYREPWVPDWAHDAGEDDLYEWMLAELNGEIEGSEVQAGFVKLSAGDDSLTPVEIKILRAAGRAAKQAGAAIGSHTIRGRVVRDQLDILESLGFPLDRFIWIHAHVDPDFDINLEMARRGAWIEYDGISWEDNDDLTLQRLQGMLDAGLGGQVLLSMDRGWYDPAQPHGGTPKPFTYFVETFLPKLRASGVGQGTIDQLTCDNPFRAFAR